MTKAQFCAIIGLLLLILCHVEKQDILPIAAVNGAASIGFFIAAIYYWRKS